MDRITAENERKTLEQEMAGIERQFPGGLRDIYFYMRFNTDNDNPDQESVRRAKLAQRWHSLLQSVWIYDGAIAQMINPGAINQYRDALQR